MFDTLGTVFDLLVSDMIIFVKEASEQISRVVRTFIITGD